MNRLSAFAAVAAACCAPLLAAAASSPPPMAAPQLPKRELHDRLLVEVNAKGQVVRVAHGDLSGDGTFDIMTIGNAMQMWIRHPDGSAETGMYSVTYDYDPSTHNVTRHPTLVSKGGSWANSPGAATRIVKDMQREEQQIEARIKAEQTKKLPDINAAVRHAVSSPSASPKP